MDLVEFLSRVVPAGAFAVIVSRNTHGGMTQRAFPRDKLEDAAGYAKFLGGKTDVWFAVASYRTAEPNGKDTLGKDKFRGSRTQENVEALRSLWLDLDLKRDGDNKVEVYKDLNEAVQWLGEFRKVTKLPAPNLWVSSGYGLHLYWVLEDAVTPDVWLPYAQALKAAFIAAGAKADLGCTVDSARILRAPETKNFKVPASPRDVRVLKSHSDYPNQLIYDALKPYISAVSAKPINYGSSNLVGGPPAVFAGVNSQATAAALANMPAKQDRLFADIATECEQVKQSLATGGNGDPYPLWYLGYMSLAHFCSDGQEWAHKLSQGDPRYTPAAVDAALQRVASEVATKGTGAPTCAHFHGCRPSVCESCPHWGKTTSPVSLRPKQDVELPKLYYRSNGGIMRENYVNGEPKPVRVIDGDVKDAVLDRPNGSYRLMFTYERAGQSFPITVDKPIPADPGRIDAYFHAMGMTLPETQTRPWREFVVAWINELRDQRVEREHSVPPFGWATKGGNYLGFAVGGTLYRPDGSQEAAPGGDPRLNAMYQPIGSLAEWQRAAELVTRGRPDLQVVVAAAFAAPLIEFTGQSGVLLSVWSRDSAVGKSSAFQIGTTVWARPSAMFSFKDTINSIIYRVGKSRVMPSYWDEVPLDSETSKGIIDLLFMLGQGKEKARLNSDATLKDAGDWKTLLVCSSNRSLMEHVEHLRNDTDAGALRLFEYHIAHQQMPLDPNAATLIAGTERNAGNAGQLYAQWLAKNPAAAKSIVEGFSRKLKDTLNPVSGERFYIAGMAAIMAGASIASLIQLVDFDRAKMWAFLVDAFNELRMRRAANLPVGGGSVDLEKIFGLFVTDLGPETLVTARYKPRGPQAKNSNMKILWAPRKHQGQLAVHIATWDRLMRVARGVWDDWCRQHNYSGSDLLKQMEGRWGAVTRRGVIGAGTHYQTGSLYYFELPLSHPELTQYYESNDSSAGGAPALAGGTA